MHKREIIICPSPDGLAQQAAAEFTKVAQLSLRDKGRFNLALSGGSTPRALYSLLATPEFSRQISWPQVHFFWGDERCVAPDHPDSNYRMVRESLLAKIEIPPANVHRMAGEKDPLTAATEYEEELKTAFQLAPGAFPCFDLILLGLGDDGHTASLFPGSDALKETQHLVVANYVAKFNAHRLTLTFPVLNRGAAIIFLVAGANKAPVVKEILREDRQSAPFPAAQVQPLDGRLLWLLTEDAAPN
ncbi:MAG: 6-phosphogluconolactonase [Alphaproteobacteria bacterium]